jgi:hypothetical protein
MKLTCLTLAAVLSAPAISYCGSAAARAYSRSLAMHPTLAYHRTTGVALPLYISTPDSAHNLPMFVPPAGTNTQITVSSELVPVPNSYSFRAAFSLWSGGFASQNGILNIQFPVRDRDRNGIRDFAQPEQTFYEGAIGRARQTWPATNVSKFEARFSRPAGEYLGAYSGYLIGSNNVNYAFSGQLGILHMAGEAEYSRGATNAITLNLLRMGKNGVETQLTGATTYRASSNYVMLAAMTLTNAEGQTYVTRPATLNRSRSRYTGTLAFVDGDLGTPWPDYKNWTLEIVDATDDNTNSVPDLSDPEYRPPSVAITAPAQTVRIRSLPTTIRGTAWDTTGVSVVEYRVEDGGVTTAFGDAEGTSRWSVTLDTLDPGTNAVWVSATDRLGNKSAEVRRLIIYTGQ